MGQGVTGMSGRWAALAALTLAALLLLPTAGGADAAGVRTGDSAKIDRSVEERMAAHRIPGSAVTVVRGGDVIHLAGYGTADREGRQVTAETPFLVGSVSKPFTAHVVRQLVLDGTLALDEPVLPHLSHLLTAPPEGFDAVTVRHLLTHTAGIGMAVGLPGTVPIHTTDDALDRRVRDVLASPLASPPGEQYTYSNAGYALLAAVVEQVTGQRFEEVLAEQIFDPLGMNDSFAGEDHAAASRMATGHRQWFGTWRPADLSFDRAGVAYGYLGSTIEDLARFLHAHLDDDPALVPASATQLARDPVEPTGWDLPLESGQGLGWMVDELAGHRVVSHAGSLGHFTAHLIMVPDADGLGIAVVKNPAIVQARPAIGRRTVVMRAEAPTAANCDRKRTRHETFRVPPPHHEKLREAADDHPGRRGRKKVPLAQHLPDRWRCVGLAGRSIFRGGRTGHVRHRGGR